MPRGPCPPPSPVQISHIKDGKRWKDFMFLGPPSPHTWLLDPMLVEESGKRQTTYITLFYDKYNHKSKEAKIEIILQASSVLCNSFFSFFSLYIPTVLEWCQLSLLNTAKVLNLFKELNRVFLVLHFLHYRSPLQRTSQCRATNLSQT